MNIHEHSCLNCGNNIVATNDIKLIWLSHPDDRITLENDIYYYCDKRKEHNRGPIITKRECLGNKNNCINFINKKYGKEL